MATVLQWFNFSGATVYYQLTNIVWKDGYGNGLTDSTDVSSIDPASSEQGQAVNVSAGIQDADLLFYNDANTASDLVLELNTLSLTETRFAPIYLLCNPSITYPQPQANEDTVTINDDLYSAGENTTGNYLVFDQTRMDASNYTFPKDAFVVGLPTMTSTALQGLEQVDDVFDQGWSWWVWALIIGAVLIVLIIVIGAVVYVLRKSGQEDAKVVQEKTVTYS